MRRTPTFGKLSNCCLLGLFMYSAAAIGSCTTIEEEEGNGEEVRLHGCWIRQLGFLEAKRSKGCS